MHAGLVLAGALPALVAMYYVDRLDAARPEPRWSLRKVAIAGGIATLPCIFIELFLTKIGPTLGWDRVFFSAFIVAAAVEELAKLLCVRWFIWRAPEFDERMDGIVYATRAALGFALVENMLYLSQQQSTGGLIFMYIMRAVLAVPGHAIWTGYMGYYAARRRFDGVGPGIVGGYAVAVFLHGLYDASIFGAGLCFAEKESGAAVGLFLFGAASILVGGIGLRRRARLAVALDDVAFAQARAVADAAAAAAAVPPVAFG
jgi:RsiW-degrading membrane proteinase PrsW (M82 family)